MANPSRWIPVGIIAGVAVFAFVVIVPVLLPSGPPPPPPPPKPGCPGTPEHLPGQRFTPGGSIPRDLKCADLRGAVFDGLDLTQYDLTRADLRGASFRHADLGQADLDGARLDRADFTSADLIQADLTGASLRDAKLSFADLTQADLTGADLRGAELWLTGSVQTETSGAQVDPVQPGMFQLGYLAVLVALWRLGSTLFRRARGQTGPGSSRRRLRPHTALSLALIPAALVYTGLLYLMGLDLAALWCVELLRPLLIAIGILLVTAAVQQFSRATPVSAANAGPPHLIGEPDRGA